MEKGSVAAIAKLWIVKADHDLEIVRRDISRDEPLTDVLCFHCQQAVEKYLKAFLVFHGIKPPRSHLIEIVLAACESIDQTFSSLRPVIYLSDFAVGLRYPDDFYMPPVAQLEKAYSDAIQVQEFIRVKMKFSF